MSTKKPEWENLYSEPGSRSPGVDRFPVPGGWLYVASNQASGWAELVFVPELSKGIEIQGVLESREEDVPLMGGGVAPSWRRVLDRAQAARVDAYLDTHPDGLLPEAEAAATQSAECDRPPAGWVCSRGRGHEGPCRPFPAPGALPGGCTLTRTEAELAFELVKEALDGPVERYRTTPREIPSDAMALLDKLRAAKA